MDKDENLRDLKYFFVEDGLDNAIIDYLDKNDDSYIYEIYPIDDENSLRKIYDLFIDDIFVEPELDIEFLYYGYYFNGKGDYEQMKRYYFIAIYKGYSEAMFRLGNFYYEQNDFKNMKIYLKMAIEKKDSSAANRFGCYYYEHKNYDKALKYFLLEEKYCVQNHKIIICLIQLLIIILA